MTTSQQYGNLLYKSVQDTIKDVADFFRARYPTAFPASEDYDMWFGCPVDKISDNQFEVKTKQNSVGKISMCMHSCTRVDSEKRIPDMASIDQQAYENTYCLTFASRLESGEIVSTSTNDHPFSVVVRHRPREEQVSLKLNWYREDLEHRETGPVHISLSTWGRVESAYALNDNRIPKEEFVRWYEMTFLKEYTGF